MRTSVFAVALSALPTLISAGTYFDWNFKNASSSTELKDLSFPMSLANTPHEHGYYFAYQYTFSGIDQIGYGGLQPQKDKDGSSNFRAVFSSFADGTETSDDNCSGGADSSSSGASCGVYVDATYDHPYKLEIKNTHGTTWTGTIVDTVLGNSTHVGSYTLPSKAGGIKTSQVGFVEYFPLNSGGSCDDQTYTNITFYPPTTKSAGLSTGHLDKPYRSGDCGDKGHRDVDQVENGGWQVTDGI